jgi:hypothetical protein
VSSSCFYLSEAACERPNRQDELEEAAGDECDRTRTSHRVDEAKRVKHCCHEQGRLADGLAVVGIAAALYPILNVRQDVPQRGIRGAGSAAGSALVARRGSQRAKARSGRAESQ